ncbi:MAG: hypothetical protein QXG05_03240 [Nitrososphaerota archaeon]
MDDDTRRFAEEYIADYAELYRIAKEKMPDGAPPEVIVFLLRGMKAALYYREKEEKKKAAPTNTVGEKDLQTILEELGWKNARNGRQWIFVTNRDGSMVEALKPLESTLEKIKEAKGMLVIGKWRYSISDGGKFLSRYPVEGRSIQ